ncbi:hypothetical protein GCM10010399_32140 [Dactylosporangium fulvum]
MPDDRRWRGDALGLEEADEVLSDFRRWVASEDAADRSVEIKQKRAAPNQVGGGHCWYSRATLFHTESNHRRDDSTNCVPCDASSSSTA